MTDGAKRYGTKPIEQMIITVRGQRVILDADLARIYGMPTRRLNEQVRRSTDRFPPDFAFVLTDQELTNLRSQFATSSSVLNRSQFAIGFERYHKPTRQPDSNRGLNKNEWTNHAIAWYKHAI